ncbi:MAG: carboxypeptidase regulatory-like domain-containing protein [Betaproteobacteria bacterium]|nr:carboxypeptidase regulatory-like domain-containing protein [Betaproteobacteria bacterium]
MTTFFRWIVVTVALSTATNAIAGGDDYDAANDKENAGPAYFGFVRDNRGSPVPNAIVVLRPKTGKAVEVKTNAVGLYRSHVSKEARPDDVSVSCEKAGFKQSRVFRRTPPGSTAMFIETDCTQQRS